MLEQVGQNKLRPFSALNINFLMQSQLISSTSYSRYMFIIVMVFIILLIIQLQLRPRF